LGFEGDVHEFNRWAATVGVSDWFGWRAFEDMPAAYLTQADTLLRAQGRGIMVDGSEL